MRNININLTAQQAKLVDKNASDFGFANRSEFIRAILRYVFLHSPQILDRLDAVAFEAPPVRDAEYISREFRKSGKYNQAFIASVTKGLKKSKYFRK